MANKPVTSPDMGQSVSDGMLEHLLPQPSQTNPQFSAWQMMQYAKRVVALEAAERLRAPVGGGVEAALTEFERLTLRHHISANYMVRTLSDAMARVRCAIPDGWRPISEAPQDGTMVLSWNGKYMAVTEWCFDGEEGYFCGDARIGPDPTHWMPLPAAPILPIAKGDDR